MENLTIIGTSHIAKQSLEEVKKAIEEGKPDIVAIELDRKRLAGLMSNKKRKPGFYDFRRVGLKGYIFSLIGAWASQKLGKIVGVNPGEEMKTAVRLAKKNKAKIAMIDQDIEVTLKRFSQKLTWKEKWNFIVDILKAVFLGKRAVTFDLRKVPSEDIIRTLIAKVKDRYPNVYKVLIYERNYIIAENLRNLMDANPDKKIVAVIGAGHKNDVIEILNKPRISYSFNFT